MNGTPRAVEREGSHNHPSSPWRADHRSRYHFAAAFVTGRRVLDIACGTGYGCPVLLAAGARSVTGVDSSREALAAATRYVQPGFDLVCADGTDLPFADGSFDAVVSFETLEHIEADDRFVAELQRVLARDGVLLLSTPNALHTRQIAGPPNPFHVREYEPRVLRKLLRQHFATVELLGQRPRPALRPCPYWEAPSQLPRGVRGSARVTIWKLASRLPAAIGSRALGRPVIPTEHEFTFEPDDVDRGHVTMAVCRG